MNNYTDTQKKLINQYRLRYIKGRLSKFSDLPEVLKTKEYLKYLQNIKSDLEQNRRIFTVEKMKCTRHWESVLKDIEERTRTKIHTEEVMNYLKITIIGEDINLAENMIRKHMEVEKGKASKSFDVKNMSDWEKFYIWWYYYTKKR